MQWVGVDVGGTFTDVVVYDEATGALEVGKSPTVPADPTVGLLNALTKLKVDLAATGRVVHGTTIGTNAVLERKGATVWMLTTRGFRDTLEIGRTNRTILYDMRAQKPAPLVPRTRVVEIDERVAFDGAVLRPLREDEVRDVVARMRAEAGDEPAALVICFLHSYAWPAHEQAAARIAAEMLPGWFLSTSADVLPEFREYERSSTAALNGYIGPKVGGYLTTLTRALAERNYGGKVFITTSSGGIVPADVAARYPVHTVLSGPAGGVAAAVNLGRLTGQRNLITYDMGGTSTDVCLIEDLEPVLTTEQHIAGLPNRTPQIEINSIGAGGGSIAWLDAGGALRVGPRSAGADPGPACYGRGGVDATITDANVVLGRAGTDVPLAGEIELDAQRAREALMRLGARLPGLGDVDALADGVVRLAVARMVSAIKEISIARGHDPRDFALVAYGGAGPMHAALLADELEMTRVIVPLAPGNFSAFGALISDLRRDYVRTRLVRTRGGADAEVERIFAELEGEARADLGAEGLAPADITLVRALGMRYVGQSWELLVRWPGHGHLTASHLTAMGGQVQTGQAQVTLAVLEAAFHGAHEHRYGHAMAREAEIVNFRLTGIGAVPKPTVPWGAPGAPQAPQRSGPGMNPGPPRAQAQRAEREVAFDRERRRVPVYRRERLPGGAPVAGPAVVEEMGSTTIIPPGWSGTVGVWGELVLERRSL